MAVQITTNEQDFEQLANSKFFLAKEFLMWLWYMIEKKRGNFSIQRKKNSLSVEIWIDDKMVFESSQGENRESQLRGGFPSSSMEASIALATGKSIREMKLGVDVGDYGNFRFLLNATDLSPRSILLPSAPDWLVAEKAETPVLQRVELLETLASIIDGVFLKFILVRMQKNWKENYISQTHQWLQGKRENIHEFIKKNV